MKARTIHLPCWLFREREKRNTRISFFVVVTIQRRAPGCPLSLFILISFSFYIKQVKFYVYGSRVYIRVICFGAQQIAPGFLKRITVTMLAMIFFVNE